MNIVHKTLRRALLRWWTLELVRLGSKLGCVVLLLLLGLDASILAGWLTDRDVAAGLLAGISAIALLGVCIVLMKAANEKPDSSQLAADLEKTEGRLRDRLNTLCFLRGKPQEPEVESFSKRIEQQTKSVLAQAMPTPRYSLGRSVLPLIGLAVLSIAAVALVLSAPPWARLVAATAVKQGAPPKPVTVAEMPPTNTVELPKEWGEVRITDPGRDIKVTKVDVVPMQIEAAANEPLQKLAWYSAVNGGEETEHPLPQPTDPRYAMARTELYLDELSLGDWDVVTYYAKATTTTRKTYASEVYFLEVRPFREDIAKIPGGEGGKANQTLGDMSRLIERQQNVIRQTHHFVQKPPPQEKLRSEERNKLSSAEKDLADGARHLYAKMATEMENTPIGEALDNLAQASKSLDEASALLQRNSMPAAQNEERTALLELAAARKIFQKTVSDNPGQFQDSPAGSEQEPIADSREKLDQIAEFRNEAASAKEFVDKAAAEQRQLAADAKGASSSNKEPLAERQDKLGKALSDFRKQHPRAFSGAQAQAGQAQQAMRESSDALRQKRSGAAGTAAGAARRLEQLSQTLKEKDLQQQLADAYRLKEMLDNQVRKLDEKTKPDQKTSSAEAAGALEENRRLLDELKKKAEQEPTRQAFGEPLRDALNDSKRQQILDKLAELQQSRDEAAQRQLAGEARDGLDNVRKAFEQSQPQTAQNNSDTPEQEQSGSLEKGMAEMEALLNRQQNGKQLSGDETGKQARQALSDIQQGLQDSYGDNEAGQQLAAGIQRMLKPGHELSETDLRGLLEKIQRFSAESSEKRTKKQILADIAHIDPDKLPASYRNRIQAYLQKLSEQ